MAAVVSSFTLLRNFAFNTRALSNVKATSIFNNNNRFLIPVQSRRSLFRTNAVDDEEALARAAAASAESGAPTMYHHL
ncbi:conserved hypothetical protein [Ricinus communis]|uniref:Uncharacterized protein n=1 Tax=Ricinus communis TaxID=3988 RepID=B9SCC4_RICCO|nr:conserved hypothetical protein [Ricinus communis]